MAWVRPLCQPRRVSLEQKRTSGRFHRFGFVARVQNTRVAASRIHPTRGTHRSHRRSVCGKEFREGFACFLCQFCGLAQPEYIVRIHGGAARAGEFQLHRLRRTGTAAGTKDAPTSRTSCSSAGRRGKGRWLNARRWALAGGASSVNCLAKASCWRRWEECSGYCSRTGEPT